MKIEEIADNLIITVECPICKNDFTVIVNKIDWYDFQNKRKLIQHCFPYLSVDRREILMSGICGTCWDKLYRET